MLFRSGGLQRAERVCAAGHGAGCSLCGSLYAQGAGGKPDPARAATFFERGCTLGDGNACAYMGAQLLDGVGVKRDVDRGLQALARSCEKLRSPQGCGMWARALLMGAGGKSGMKQGASVADALCSQGDAPSCVLAAVAFLEGRGVDRNEERGARYVLVACDGGYRPACELRKRLPPDLVARLEKQAAATPPPPPAAPAPTGLVPLGPSR